MGTSKEHSEKSNNSNLQVKWSLSLGGDFSEYIKNYNHNVYLIGDNTAKHPELVTNQWVEKPQSLIGKIQLVYKWAVRLKKKPSGDDLASAYVHNLNSSSDNMTTQYGQHVSATALMT